MRRLIVDKVINRTTEEGKVGEKPMSTIKARVIGSVGSSEFGMILGKILVL